MGLPVARRVFPDPALADNQVEVSGRAAFNCALLASFNAIAPSLKGAINPIPRNVIGDHNLKNRQT